MATAILGSDVHVRRRCAPGAPPESSDLGADRGGDRGGKLPQGRRADRSWPSWGGEIVPLRMVHVGLGGWGQDWEKNALPRVKEVEAVAWVDADPATLAAARRALRLPAKLCFPTLETAIEAVEAEAVLVTV